MLTHHGCDDSLSQMDNICLRVQIIKNMAFVYEPFSMDCPSASMILDWGSPTDNQTTARHISDNASIHPFLHTFILPVNKVGFDSTPLTSLQSLPPGCLVLYWCPYLETHSTFLCLVNIGGSSKSSDYSGRLAELSPVKTEGG